MRILFHTNQVSHSRHFIDIILALEQQGHEIILTGLPRTRYKIDIPVHKSLRGHQGIKGVLTFRRRADDWDRFVASIRRLKCALNYELDAFSMATGLRERAYIDLGEAIKFINCEEKLWHEMHNKINEIYGAAGIASPLLSESITLSVDSKKNIINAIEGLIPPDISFTREIAKLKPHVIAITPVVFGLTTYQTDVIKASHALGIPIVFLPFSWDNLTNKGTISVQCDHNIVWNEIQKEELIKYHEAKPEAITVCGAWRFDNFFKKRASMEKAAFLSQHGIQESSITICYLCSSSWVTPNEVNFIRSWIGKIRQYNDDRIRTATIIIRPHPMHMKQWENISQTLGAGVIFSMPIGQQESDEQSLFDNLYFSDVVVGINTSAMIEAAIVDRPLQAIIQDEFYRGQEGTVHFNYLLTAGEGLLHLSKNLDDHFSQMSWILDNIEAAKKRSRNFVKAFVRPHGLDKEVTPFVVDVLEKISLVQKNAVVFDEAHLNASMHLLKYVALTFPSENFETKQLAYMLDIKPDKAADTDEHLMSLNDDKSDGIKDDLNKSSLLQRLKQKFKHFKILSKLGRPIHKLRNKTVRIKNKPLASVKTKKIKTEKKYYQKENKYESISKNISSNVEVVKIAYDKHNIKVLVSSKMERALWLHGHQKESWLLKWIEEHIKEGDVFYDIGASVGGFSLIAANYVGNSGKVIAFESGFLNFSRLCENITLNKWDDRILPISLPLSSETKTGTFISCSPTDSSQSQQLPQEAQKGEQNGPKANKFAAQIVVITLDDLFKLYKLPAPTHIRLDVDRFDMHILNGVEGILKKQEVKTVLARIDCQYHSEVMKLLGKVGFRLFSAEKDENLAKRNGSMHLFFGKNNIKKLTCHKIGL